MPLKVQTLSTDAPPQAVRDAISESIKQCLDEGGKTQKECAGMVYGILKERGFEV